MSENNIAAVVILYNPKQEFLHNIETYAKFLSKVYIVDNSESDNVNLASRIANAEYIANRKNLGIAAALNIGCDKAMADGYTHVMTMDQDSQWSEDDIKGYLKSACEVFNSEYEVKSVACEYNYNFKPSILGRIKRTVLGSLKKEEVTPISCPSIDFVDKTICSGNIIDLEAYKKLGGFNEWMFIDEVDYDYCFRLINAGHKICRINTYKMNHFLGETITKTTILPHRFNHSAFRLRYIVRNRLYMMDEYPELTAKYNYKKDYRDLFIWSCVINKHCFKHIKVWRAAVREYKEYKARKKLN